MRRNSLPKIALICAAIFFFATTDSTAQTKPAAKRDEAPLRVVLAGLVHGHAFGFFDQFQHRADLRVVGIAEADHELAAQFAKRYGLEPGLFYSDLEEIGLQSVALCKLRSQFMIGFGDSHDSQVRAMLRRRQDSGFGELRNDLVSQQSSGLWPGA